MNPVCGCQINPVNDRQVISLPWFTVYECGECGIWYVEKLLKPDAEAELKHSHKLEAYLSSFAAGYLNSFPTWRKVTLFNKAISVAIELRPHARLLLDIGCGGGRFLQFMRSYQPQVVTLGVEISPLLAKKAVQKGLVVIQGDAQCMGLRDFSFDIITMWDVIEHLTRPIKALKEISRLLLPKGILIIFTPNAGSLLHWLSLQ